MIVKIKTGGNNKFVMLVYPADKKFAEEKVKDFLKASKLRLATEEEVLEITGGVQPGGVPPFGNLFNLEVYADRTLFENEKIVVDDAYNFDIFASGNLLLIITLFILLKKKF